VGRFVRVLRDVLSSRATARTTAAFVLFVVAEYAVWIGMLVYAYGHGGATAAGLVAVAQLVPGTLLSPLVAAVADRRSPTTLLVGGYLVQAVGMVGVAATLWAGGPPLVAYAFAIVASTAMGTTRPAQYALLPALARDAQQLAGATAVAGWAENGGILLAAVVAAVFLALDQIGTLFAVNAAFVVLAAVLVFPVKVPGLAVADDDEEPGAGALVTEGIREVATHRRPRLLVGLLTVQFVVVGALDVLFVVLALSVLHKGQGWVGYLNGVYGLGAVLSGVLTAHLVGRRLTLVLWVSALVVGAGLAATALTSQAAVVLVLLGVVGAGRAVLVIGANTLLPRVVPATMVGRVFGMVEGLSMAGLAIGSLLTPLLIKAGGHQVALVVVGCLLPATVLAGWATLRRREEGASVPVVEMALLRSVPHFAELPAPALETLAGALERVDAVDGQVLIRQGDEGDRFYVVADGQVAVTVDGQDRGTRGRGSGLGEIALLRRTPRTATVTARGPVTLFALEAPTFLAAVGSHAATRRRADQAATAWTEADQG